MTGPTVDRTAEHRAGVQAIECWLDRGGGGTAAELVDLIGHLEDLANVVTAAQLTAVRRLAEQQTIEDLAAGVPERDAGSTVGAQVGLARRQPPRRGVRDVHLAGVLADELPHTRRAMLEGTASGYQAELVVTHTACLSRADRARVDELVAPELGSLSPRQVVHRVKHHAYRLDPEAATRQAAMAHRERHVSVRPVPDTMARVAAHLPAAQAVAVWAALDREAKALRAAGDERTLGQLRADVLVGRVTGQLEAPAVPVEVQLVVPAGTLFGSTAVLRALTSGDEPAVLSGYGPLPAPVARQMVRDTAACSLRRLLLDPESGTLVGRDPRRRLFSAGERDLLVARDRTCRTPYCDAPVREADHVVPFSEGGPTTLANAQGLCTQCNQTRNHPRWSARPLGPPTTTTPRTEPTARARLLALARQACVETTTPTGHRYTSRTPQFAAGPLRPGAPPG